MNHKVLLADDSLTIQKVIKITLANQPFDIVDCSSEEELFQKLKSTNPEIVFLDFNLSEKHTGYELTSKIKSICPDTQVLLLLGTFDTVDDATMTKSGAADKIVKPFDSNKFISICKRLVDNEVVEEIIFPEDKDEEAFVVPKSEDQWTISHSVEKKELPVSFESKIDKLVNINVLDQEVSDWGMNIPNVISNSDTDSHMELPPVIENNVSAIQKPKYETQFPSDDDLDYPTIEQLKDQSNEETVPKKEPKSKLISLDSLNPAVDLDFQIEHDINSMDETDVKSIEDQIRDEVEEDLWTVDEFEDLKNEVSAKMEEVKSQFQPSIDAFDESLFKPLDADDEIPWTTAQEQVDSLSFERKSSSIDKDELLSELRSEMQEMIKSEVKAYMDKMFAQNVEKVSWEVIPDLAENLIRQELSKISNKILNDTSKS